MEDIIKFIKKLKKIRMWSDFVVNLKCFSGTIMYLTPSKAFNRGAREEPLGMKNMV